VRFFGVDLDVVFRVVFFRVERDGDFATFLFSLVESRIFVRIIA
jgi:hypothetical protein